MKDIELLKKYWVSGKSIVDKVAKVDIVGKNLS